MNRFFRDSPVVEPMKRELEMLIARHSSESNENAGVQLPPPEDVQEGHLSRLADEARTRQRLAIHSLIGRADFVDDSNEVTTPQPPTDHHPNGALSVAARPQRQQRSIRSNTNLKTAPHILRSHSFGGAAQAMDPKQSDSGVEVVSNEPTNYAQDDQNQWLDGMRLAFNPWMGWPETLETYGFTQALDDEYF
jgi:hypothetical protein